MSRVSPPPACHKQRRPRLFERTFICRSESEATQDQHASDFGTAISVDWSAGTAWFNQEGELAVVPLCPTHTNVFTSCFSIASFRINFRNVCGVRESSPEHHDYCLLYTEAHAIFTDLLSNSLNRRCLYQALRYLLLLF